MRIINCEINKMQVQIKESCEDKQPKYSYLVFTTSKTQLNKTYSKLKSTVLVWIIMNSQNPTLVVITKRVLA